MPESSWTSLSLAEVEPFRGSTEPGRLRGNATMSATGLSPLRRIVVRLQRERRSRSRARRRFFANGAELYTIQSSRSDKNEIHRQECGRGRVTPLSRNNDGSATGEKKLAATIPRLERGVTTRGRDPSETIRAWLHRGPRLSCLRLTRRPESERAENPLLFDDLNANSVTAQVCSPMPASGISAVTWSVSWRCEHREGVLGVGIVEPVQAEQALLLEIVDADVPVAGLFRREREIASVRRDRRLHVAQIGVGAGQRQERVRDAVVDLDVDQRVRERGAGLEGDVATVRAERRR